MFNLFERFISASTESNKRVELSYNCAYTSLTMSVDRITFSNGKLTISNESSHLIISPLEVSAEKLNLYIKLTDNSLIAITFHLKHPLAQIGLQDEARYISKLFK